MTTATGTLLVRQQALTQLPTQLRQDLLDAFEQIVRNFAEGRWEPSELNGGKLAEAAYSVCEGIATANMPVRAQKPRDMVAACKALEQYTASPRSIRIQIPRMLVALYEIRNNRNVGHVGGDVDPNHMDAVCVLQMAKWVVAELIRVLHQLPADDAAALVDALVERDVPLVWKVGGRRRVLDPGMSAKDKTLLLLHGAAAAVAEDELRGWVEYTNATGYRRDVLRRAHRDKLLEYDPDTKLVAISPTGVAYVEEKLLRSGR
jgi:hypothetical protein